MADCVFLNSHFRDYGLVIEHLSQINSESQTAVMIIPGVVLQTEDTETMGFTEKKMHFNKLVNVIPTVPLWIYSTIISDTEILIPLGSTDLLTGSLVHVHMCVCACICMCVCVCVCYISSDPNLTTDWIMVSETERKHRPERVKYCWI